MPVYVLETANSGLLAYTRNAPRRDMYFEGIMSAGEVPAL
jgi:hypothetical protein